MAATASHSCCPGASSLSVLVPKAAAQSVRYTPQKHCAGCGPQITHSTPHACWCHPRTKLRAAGLLDKSRHAQLHALLNGGQQLAIPVSAKLTHSWLTHYLDPELLAVTTLTSEVNLVCKSAPINTGARLRTNLIQLLEKCPTEERERLLLEVPTCWERHGDLVLLPATTFTSPEWEHITPCDQLWRCVTTALGATRLARQARIDPGLLRQSQVELLWGTDGWVCHVDNHIQYWFDVTRCMFSAGNITEKMRLARLPCAEQVIVDLYAGIGYFTLPYLVHAGAALVYACEWNPDAVLALRRNCEANGVTARCVILQGDNAEVAPTDIADRVNLGLIPSSRAGWPVAIRALRRSTGGWLHVHENVTVPVGITNKSAVFASAGQAVCETMRDLLLQRHQQRWTVVLHHVECVKSYAPRIFHVVGQTKATLPWVSSHAHSQPDLISRPLSCPRVCRSSTSNAGHLIKNAHRIYITNKDMNGYRPAQISYTFDA